MQNKIILSQIEAIDYVTSRWALKEFKGINSSQTNIIYDENLGLKETKSDRNGKYVVVVKETFHFILLKNN